MKQKHFIDSQKAVTPFFIFLLLAIYAQWDNPTAWLYLALHGSYGLLWNLKSRIFPDRSWEKETGWGFGLVTWTSLCLYWVAPWLLMSRAVQVPGWYMALCTSLVVIGVFLHFCADMQKYVALQLKPQHLITGGLFARLRNMNYFGELLIYTGFGLLAWHWLPVLILLAWVILVWLPKMAQKERSLSRYPEFREYKQRTRLFIPFLF